VAAIAIVVYAKKQLICWKVAIPCAIFSVAGTFLGFYISGFMDQILLSKIFGVMFILTGIFQWFRKERKCDNCEP
jgi:uncharacterized membrane protein YfcA